MRQSELKNVPEEGLIECCWGSDEMDQRLVVVLEEAEDKMVTVQVSSGMFSKTDRGSSKRRPRCWRLQQISLYSFIWVKTVIHCLFFVNTSLPFCSIFRISAVWWASRSQPPGSADSPVGESKDLLLVGKKGLASCQTTYQLVSCLWFVFIWLPAHCQLSFQLLENTPTAFIFYCFISFDRRRQKKALFVWKMWLLINQLSQQPSQFLAPLKMHSTWNLHYFALKAFQM